MAISKQRAAWLAAGIGWAIASGAPALADDTEIFFVDPANITTQPNILFIFDNSGSMDDRVESQTPYDPATTYPAAASCGTNRVYWTTTGGTNPPLPNCTEDTWFDRSALKCKAATDQFAAGAEKFGGRLEQYDPTGATSDHKWRAISATEKSRIVECQNDAGIHSDGTDPKLYARDAAADSYGDASEEISWTNTRTTLWDSNYLSWYYGPTSSQRKIDIVKAVAKNMLNSINGVNVGLMTYNERQGGHVDYALEDVATARANMIAQVDALQPGGFTPLSETLYEAYRYLSGRSLVYGDVGPIVSVPASRAGGGGSTYMSPLAEGCQKNFIVYLSDGLPTEDQSSNGDIESLIGRTCDGTAGDGYCLDDLAEYMGTTPYGNDVNTTVTGDQRVTTYTIGFDKNVPILEQSATRSGGTYFEANNASSLATALTSILFDILSESSTFTAPAVSVNNFNRTRNLNDLFISVFTATGDAHWPGNLKKYKLRASDGAILDANGVDAVDPATGFFAKGTQSIWSATVDEDSVALGGAASNLPPPAARKVYTNVSGGDLNAVSNAVVRGNSAITDVTLNTGQPGGPTHDEVIDFMRGLDKTGTSPRYEMGDPLHAQPASVTYDSGKTLIYFATNDGYLHAIDTTDGVEDWAFVPREFLDDQVDLYRNETAETRHYGIDGSPRVQMISDNDGVVEATNGEKVFLFFGMRRGGDFYYGLDVTDPNDPQVMWRLPGAGAQALDGNGQSWSNPVPARMDIQTGSQSASKLVLVFGAGYDVKNDDYNMVGVDNSGKGIFIVDSETGNVLWRGANAGATGTLNATFANMNYSIPSDIKVVDLNTDGFADRMYAADMGGQVWRFDVFNGQAPSSLVTGGVIAQVGGAPSAAPAITDTRRFYYSPDVALVTADQPFIHIGIGSGHRERPNSTFNTDRFYALRDYNTFTKLTQTQYDTITPVTDSQLEDITNDTAHVMPAGSPGWKLTMVHSGEKVLAEARTFNNQVFFTSFTPGAGVGDTANCKPALGTNRLYTVSLFNGAPVNNLDASTSGPLTDTDRYRIFNGSLASEVVFIFPSPDDPTTCVGDQCTPPPIACVDLFCFPPGFANNPVRTFWSERAID
jgi:type IV pilus assembly protein PilY1